MRFNLNDLEEMYDLELDLVIEKINKISPKNVLLQFPEGLKPYSLSVVDYISSKISSEIRIWLGDCFGSCDTPNSSCDLLISFGHAPWQD